MRFTRTFASATVGLVSIVLAGCGETNHIATFTPQFSPSAASRFTVGDVIDSSDRLKQSDLPPDFDPSAELKTQIEQHLAASGIVADGSTVNVITLVPTIVDYEPGNAFQRWLAPGAGTTKLTVKVDLEQGGESLGIIRARRTIEMGGIYTIGDWRSIFGPVAGDVVDELQKKLGQTPH